MRFTFSLFLAAVHTLSILVLVSPRTSFSQSLDQGNSNLWPTFTDQQVGFRISYPSPWVMSPRRTQNAKFSASPLSGPGNCNVVAKPSKETASMSQAELNVEIRTLGIDAASWAGYIGAVGTNVRVVSARRAAINSVPALVGVVDVDLENLQGKYVRRQIIAMTFTPGMIWSVNCGVSVADKPAAERAFVQLSPVFEKVLGSFAFTR